MGGFNTSVLAPRTSQILADGDLDMRNHRIVNLREGFRKTDAVNMRILLTLLR